MGLVFLYPLRSPLFFFAELEPTAKAADDVYNDVRWLRRDMQIRSGGPHENAAAEQKSVHKLLLP